MELRAASSFCLWIEPSGLDREASWDALLFVRSCAPFLADGTHHPALTKLARVMEGQRTSFEKADPDGADSYRASSLSMFELGCSRAQWNMASVRGGDVVQPGDVVVKRLAPVAAAVVPPGVPALPADAGLHLVRGLGEAQAWWATYALNYPACGDYLLSKSGRQILSRVALSVLRDWPVPPPPAGFADPARRLSAVLQQRTFVARQIAALEAEVDRAVSGQIAATAYEEVERRFAQTPWTRFFDAALLDASWLPVHVASAACADILGQDRDWQPLREGLRNAGAARERFAGITEPIVVLRLSDVGSVPLVPVSLAARVPPQASRIFQHSVEAEEVLLSTLGSSPRVAFAFQAPWPPVYAVDHWVRLRFRTHAAAYALILQTGTVTRQLRSFASGSVQQFIRPEDIQRLFLPKLPEDTLADWDRSFRSLAKAWQTAEAEWHCALDEGWQIFRETYHLPPIA